MSVKPVSVKPVSVKPASPKALLSHGVRGVRSRAPTAGVQQTVVKDDRHACQLTLNATNLVAGSARGSDGCMVEWRFTSLKACSSETRILLEASLLSQGTISPARAETWVVPMTALVPVLGDCRGVPVLGQPWCTRLRNIEADRSKEH